MVTTRGGDPDGDGRVSTRGLGAARLEVVLSTPRIDRQLDRGVGHVDDTLALIDGEVLALELGDAGLKLAPNATVSSRSRTGAGLDETRFALWGAGLRGAAGIGHVGR